MEICTSHYNEDLEWLKKSEFPVTVVHHEGGSDFPQFNETYVIANKGYEASAYLTFIIRRYDSLPEYTAFIHGHEKADHQKVPCMLNAIRTANIQKYTFIHLNNLWFYGFIEGDNKYVKNKCLVQTSIGAQFIVHKDRILKNSRKYYENLLNSTETKTDAQCLEYTWHVIFGEPVVSYPHTDLFIPGVKTVYTERWIVPEPEKLSLRINVPPRDEHDPNMIFIKHTVADFTPGEIFSKKMKHVIKMNDRDISMFDISSIYERIYKNSIEVKQSTSHIELVQ